MAKFKLTFYGYPVSNERFAQDPVIDIITVSANKMSNKWMETHYGKYWRDEYEAMYHCTPTSRKKCGITWVIKYKGRYGERTEICGITKNPVPHPFPQYYHKVISKQIFRNKY